MHYFRPSFDKILGHASARHILSKGKDLWVKGLCTFTCPEKMKVGDYCRIGKGAYFHCYGGLTIGNNVQFARYVTIYTSNHNFHSAAYVPYDNTEIGSEVIIGDNVWVGMHAHILPGVKIGNNAIVGMAAVVTKNVPDNAIIVGINRIVGYREKVEENFKLFGKEYPNA